jgi:hypothetical protein
MNYISKDILNLDEEQSYKISKLIDKKQSSPESEVQGLLAQYSSTTPKLKSVDLADYLKNYLSTTYYFN